MGRVDPAERHLALRSQARALRDSEVVRLHRLAVSSDVIGRTFKITRRRVNQIVRLADFADAQRAAAALRFANATSHIWN